MTARKQGTSRGRDTSFEWPRLLFSCYFITIASKPQGLLHSGRSCQTAVTKISKEMNKLWSTLPPTSLFCFASLIYNVRWDGSLILSHSSSCYLFFRIPVLVVAVFLFVSTSIHAGEKTTAETKTDKIGAFALDLWDPIQIICLFSNTCMRQTCDVTQRHICFAFLSPLTVFLNLLSRFSNF
jgi:hypothetical protein